MLILYLWHVYGLSHKFSLLRAGIKFSGGNNGFQFFFIMSLEIRQTPRQLIPTWRMRMAVTGRCICYVVCGIEPSTLRPTYRGDDKSLARPGRKSYNDRRFWCSYILFIIIIGGILVLFIYITRLASNEIFSRSNKIHREVTRAKDLSAPL